MGVLLPYCDGDVRSLEGVHYYDDARYNVVTDFAAKHTFLVLGANHNFYNTVWTPGLFPAGAVDDWFEYTDLHGDASDSHCASFGTGKRLSAAQQRGTALAYVKAFFRAYVGNRTDLLPYLKAQVPPPPSARTSLIYPSYHPAVDQRRDVNRLLTSTDLKINSLGGSVNADNVLTYTLCGGNSPQPARCLSSYRDLEQEPHVATEITRGLSQLKLAWSTSWASYTNAIPQTKSDIGGFTTLQFRAAINFTSRYNLDSRPQDLTVLLTDTTGRLVKAQVGAYSRALFYPPGDDYSLVPKVVLNTVSIPLSVFRNLGVNLSSIKNVKFEFDRTVSGELLISDLAFVR